MKLTGRDQTCARQRRGPTRRLGSRAHVKYSSSSPVGAGDETRRGEVGRTRFWNHDGGMWAGVIRDCSAHVQRLPLAPPATARWVLQWAVRGTMGEGGKQAVDNETPFLICPAAFACCCAVGGTRRISACLGQCPLHGQRSRYL